MERSRGVRVRDVSVLGKAAPTSHVFGCDVQHAVQGVAIENLRIGGRLMKNPEEAAIRVGPFVQDFHILNP